MLGTRPTATIAAALIGAALLLPAPSPAAQGPRPIEDYRYDHAERCTKRIPPGTKRLERWLGRNTGGESWGISRCEKLSPGSYSLHSEGRAIDWHLDARVGKQRRQAMRLIRERLLATDRHGNENALARRIGVQGIIYDCRSWWSGPGGLGRYSYCYKGNGKRKRNLDPTAAHVDHLHIELNWPGARLRTSFWR